MSVIEKLKNQVTGKTLGWSTLSFIGMLIFMNILGARFTSMTGEQVLDFSIGYSPNEAYQMVSQYGESGDTFYRIILLLDTIFPIVYLIFGSLLLGFVLHKFYIKKEKLFLLLLLPIIGMILDWLENVMIVLILNQFPEPFDLFAQLCASFTILKFTFLGLTLILAAILAIIGFSRKLDMQ